MISINKLSVQFSGKDLFNDVSFIINDKDRIGLTGKNGAGKSTLLKILAKQQEPHSGSIVVTTGHQVGYLPQEIIPNSQRNVLDEALTAFEEANLLEAKIEQITYELGARDDYESEEYSKLIHQLSDANDRYHLIGGDNRQAQTERVLTGLGFKHSDLSRKMTEFSSGWQMRVELAKILLRNPEVMLLDEPTNHLDIESIQWFESFLSTYQGTIVLVSHDRAFLDNVTNRTIEIVLGHVEDYKTSYSNYILQRQERRASQQATFENQQKEIEDIERFVERFRATASKAKQVQSRVKMLNKIERVEIDQFDKSAIHFRFPPAPHSGKIAVETENVGKKFGEKRIFEHLNFVLERGEKVAFVGKNGEGKTTFSRIIVGELEHEGSSKLGHQVKLGYFAQNQAALLDGNKTVFETIDEVAVGEIRTKIRNILGSFLFGGDDIDKKVKVLSGGEKMRLALAKLLLSPINLLILDEPTNHLDMPSKDVLKTALMTYDGAMIVVSHDRDFLQGLTDKVYEFVDGKMKTHIGDVYQFLEDRKMEDFKELERAKKTTKVEKIIEAAPADNKQQREEKKNQERELRKIKTQIEQKEKEIAELEAKKKEMDDILMNPANISDSNVFVQYNHLKEKLEKRMAEWENLSLQLDEAAKA